MWHFSPQNTNVEKLIFLFAMTSSLLPTTVEGIGSASALIHSDLEQVISLCPESGEPEESQSCLEQAASLISSTGNRQSGELTCQGQIRNYWWIWD